MGIARVVVTQGKKKTAVACCVCHGNKKVKCDVCAGEKAIRYHPFKALPVNSSRMPLTACAMCGASGEQTCLNCLGEGTVSPAHPRLKPAAAAAAAGGAEAGGAVGLGAIVPPTA
ncbi:hypothetical protein OEZ85_011558 [Tetradesmus obliquus]|uniref:Uncharacterized protein n=1 Tax=Tetradesmus obliquus TaxID=3088 RepID=A0ABY8TQR0_TETOB|nr:hypothetical protein OEZ85_011558 [Tetradesmus obliquus]